MTKISLLYLTVSINVTNPVPKEHFGLGLNIANELVSKLDGRIRLLIPRAADAFF